MALRDLPAPKQGFRLGRDTSRLDGKIEFRTLREEYNEEMRRIRKLKRGKGLSVNEHARSLALARSLSLCLDGEPPETLASALFTRGKRGRILGNVWETLVSYEQEKMALITLRPKGMLYSADQLSTIDPRLLMKRLTNDLSRREISKASGFAFAALDAEFDANRDGGVWDFHYHVIAAGDKIEAFAHLREARKYENARTHRLEQGLPISPRVHIAKGLTNLPDPVTYAFESWVPHRPTRLLADGTLERSRKKARIPSPFHEHWLMWVDRWKIEDLLLLHGMTATKEGFIISNP